MSINTLSGKYLKWCIKYFFPKHLKYNYKILYEKYLHTGTKYFITLSPYKRQLYHGITISEHYLGNPIFLNIILETQADSHPVCAQFFHVAKTH